MAESVTLDGYTITSTSETADQIQAGLAALDGKPVPEPADDAEAETEGAEKAATPESEAGKTLAAKKNTLETRKKSIQAQIDELVKSRGETQRERDAIKAELEALRTERDSIKAAQKSAASPGEVVSPKTSDAADDPEPKEEDFENYRDFIKAQSRWEARQEFKEQDRKAREVRQRDLAQRAEQARFATFSDRLEATRKEHADFDARIDAGPGLTKAMQEALLDSEIPGMVMLHLADPAHRATYDAILALSSPMAQYAAMKKLEGRLEAAADKPRGPAPKVEATTEAPEPIKPLGNVPGTVVSDGEPDPETATQAEWNAWHNSQLRKTKKR